jgi:hypothetical protein
MSDALYLQQLDREKEPTWQELWDALEQVSSGTVIIDGERHNIDEEVAEWADGIIWRGSQMIDDLK